MAPRSRFDLLCMFVVMGAWSVSSHVGNIDVQAINNNISEPVVAFQVLGFNYDFAKRTVSRVKEILNTAEMIANQTQTAFEIGLINPNDLEEIRQFLFTQLTSNVGGIMVSIEAGATIGYMFHNDELLCLQGQHGACDPGHHFAVDEVEAEEIACLSFHQVDRLGLPTELLRQQTVLIDVDVTDTATWVKIASLLQMLDAGAMYSTPLVVKQNNDSQQATATKIGLISSIVFASQVDTFLSSEFQTNLTNDPGFSTNSRVVFITNDQQEILGASVAGVSSTTINTTNGLVTVSGNVSTCTNDIIRRAGEIVGNLPDSFHNDYTIVVSHDLLIQQPVILRSGLQWHVVSARLGHPSKDYPTTGSLSFLITVGISAFLFLLIIVLVQIIVQFRQMRLWRYAHPTWLLMMLAANVLCLVYAVVSMITPGDHQCELIAWARSCALIMVGATTLAKVELTAHTAVTHDLDLSSSSAASRAVLVRLKALGFVVFVQLILFAIQQANDLNDHVSSTFADSDGTLVLRRICGAPKSRKLAVELAGLQVVNDVLNILVNVVAVWRAVAKRNMSVLCDESRGLVVAAVEGLMMCGVVVGLTWSTGAKETSLSVVWFQVVVVLWYVATMMMFVFLPRVYRHVTQGDLTVSDLRLILATFTAQHGQKQSQAQLQAPPQRQQQEYVVHPMQSSLLTGSVKRAVSSPAIRAFHGIHSI